MTTPKPPDVNDLWRAGQLDPFAAGASMRDPELADRVARVAALNWVTPNAAWIDAVPEPAKQLLFYPDVPGATTRRGMLRRGKVGILAAAGGVGKTYALCGLALAVVTRKDWLNRFPVGAEHRRVALILGEEDTEEIRRRLHLQARAMELTSLDHGDAMTRMLVLPGAGLDALALTQAEEPGVNARTEFADALWAFLDAKAREDRANPGWDLVVLDPLSRFAGPDVEKDNAAATRLMQVLERFTKLPGNPTVLVAHHTSKASRADGVAQSAAAVRGASALVDGARWVANLEEVARPEGYATGHARFSVGKSNYGLTGGDVLLTRLDGGGLRAATPAETDELAAAKKKKPSDGEDSKPTSRW